MGEGPAALSARTLCEAFQLTAQVSPEAPALKQKDSDFVASFAEYAAAVRRRAAGLAALGVGRGDTVGFMLTNRPGFFLTDSAAMHLGAACFSVYNTSSPEQIEYVVADAGNRAIVTEPEFLDRVLAVRERVDTLEHVVVLGGEAPAGTISVGQLEAMGEPDFDFEAAWRAVEPDDVLWHPLRADGLRGLRLLLSRPARDDRLLDRGQADRLAGRPAHLRKTEGGAGGRDGRRDGPRETRRDRVGDGDRPAAHAGLHGQRGPGRAAGGMGAGRRARLLEDPGDARPRPGRVLLRRCRADPARCDRLLPLDRDRDLRALGALGDQRDRDPEPARCDPGRDGWAAAAGRRGEARGGRRGDGARLDRDEGLPQPAREDRGGVHRGRLAADRRRRRVRRGRVPPVGIESKLKGQSPLVANAIAIGDRRPYVVALLALDPETLAARGVTADDPDVAAEIERAVDAANERLSRVEQIKRFHVVAGEWLPGGDELTPTMKLKRKPIAAKYAAEIERLYAV